MRIIDKNGVEILNPDLSLGKLVEESIFVVRHEAVEAVEEEGHYEVIAEYPNGGKDVEWIVDVAGVEAQEAWDEYENVQRYILYTKEELTEIEKMKNTPTYEERLDALESAMLEMMGVTENG